MDRRRFVAVIGVIAFPLDVHAQAVRGVPRIGWLGAPTRESAEAYVMHFRRGLNDLAWIEGRNISIEWRFAEGRADRLPNLAAELVKLGVDVIVVPSTPTVLAAKNATKSIPIVTVSVGDPVALGLVKSLARPDGNITGLTSSVDPKITGKVLELLKESVPKASRIAVLWNPATPGNSAAVREAQNAAKPLNASLQLMEARSSGDLETAFAAMTAQRADALHVLSDALFVTHRTRIAEMAAQSRLPAIYGTREYVEAGGLMSYGPSLGDLFRRAATYVDRILKGAKPSDLPIEQPTKFELVINLKTARALGLSVPQPVLLRADDVIQ
jgi:putative tryptophan/tyrosine transport system substrate-binding protein